MRTTWAIGAAWLVCGTCVAADSIPAPAWTLTTLYSYSSLSNERGDWHEGETELLYRATENFIAGSTLVVRNRESGTDTLFGVLGSYLLTPRLEMHGNARWTPSADFSARQTYGVGAEWRVLSPVSVLLDYQWQGFPAGRLHQYKPAVTFWVNETTFLTVRYAYGRAYSDHSFTAWSVKLTVGLPADTSLGLSWAHGTDPEKDPGVPGVLLTTADTYDLFVRIPFAQHWQIIAGVEYEDRENLYTRTMGTVGLSMRF
jgi:YaiO family outer membrane protein